jgi:hypothetical protein
MQPFFQEQTYCGHPSDDVGGCHNLGVSRLYRIQCSPWGDDFISAYSVRAQERIVKHSFRLTGCQTPPGSVVSVSQLGRPHCIRYPPLIAGTIYLFRLAYEHSIRATEVCSLHSQRPRYLHRHCLPAPGTIQRSNTTVQPLMPETAALLMEWVKDKQPGTASRRSTRPIPIIASGRRLGKRFKRHEGHRRDYPKYQPYGDAREDG